ncbi:MAG: histidine phosphatase family protein [Patescibacteria group bacterium]|nr:histidine phosphatase family protein [Patescibacteria group bacterium]
MTRVYLARHGVTDFNDQGRYLGRSDVSLNELGRKQAEETKDRISKFNIDIVISSPLKRAIETANIIKPSDLEILSESAFIERSVGVYEGLTKDEAKGKYPELFARNVTRIFNEAPTNGETILDAQNRVFTALYIIGKVYIGKDVLIVTHAFVAKVVNKYFNQNLSEQEFFDFILQPSEVKEYTFEKEGDFK